MAYHVTVKCALNSVYISDEDGLRVMGQSPYGRHGIQEWQFANKYQQKAIFTDEIAIQVHTQYATRLGGTSYTVPVPNLYICDYYDPNSGNFHVIGAAANNIITGSSIDLNVAPYMKGRQFITGNDYVNPYSGDVTPLNSSMWVFDFTTLGISTKGTYYLLLDNISYNDPYPTEEHQYLFSEPIYMTDTLANLPTHTLLLQSTYNTNVSGSKNVLVSGWLTSPTEPYSPVFGLRFEGFIVDFDLKAINIGYMKQSYDQSQIFTEQKRMKTLKVGELSTGIPPYLLEMITSGLISDMWAIDDYSYILFNPSAQTSLSDLWKTRRSDVWTLVYAATAIMERYEAQGAIVTPTPIFYERIFTGEFGDEFA